MLTASKVRISRETKKEREKRKHLAGKTRMPYSPVKRLFCRVPEAISLHQPATPTARTHLCQIRRAPPPLAWEVSCAGMHAIFASLVGVSSLTLVSVAELERAVCFCCILKYISHQQQEHYFIKSLPSGSS